MPNATKMVTDEPTTSLDSLDLPPIFRGCLDHYEDGTIRGWALDARSITIPIELDLYIANIKIASTKTNTLRPDISDILDASMLAGFAFDFRSVKKSTARLATSALGKQEKLFAAVPEIIEVRPKNCLNSLPASSVAKKTEVDLSDLIKLFKLLQS